VVANTTSSAPPPSGYSGSVSRCRRLYKDLRRMIFSRDSCGGVKRQSFAGLYTAPSQSQAAGSTLRPCHFVGGGHHQDHRTVPAQRLQHHIYHRYCLVNLPHAVGTVNPQSQRMASKPPIPTPPFYHLCHLHHLTTPSVSMI
jgi:hypothetical protein